MRPSKSEVHASRSGAACGSLARGAVGGAALELETLEALDGGEPCSDAPDCEALVVAVIDRGALDGAVGALLSCTLGVARGSVVHPHAIASASTANLDEGTSIM